MLPPDGGRAGGGTASQQRFPDTPPATVAAWCGTLGSVLPMATRTALGDRILEEHLDGRRFSALLNQHALCELNVQGLTLAMMQKVRRCWHKDFPASTSIRMSTPPPVPNHEQVASPQVSIHRGGTGSFSTPLQSSSNAQLRKPHGETLELLRASLDCVSEKANLDRKDVYLWVHNVLPNEVWQPLWDSMTADLLQQQQISPAASVALPSSPPPTISPTPTKAQVEVRNGERSFAPLPIDMNRTHLDPGDLTRAQLALVEAANLGRASSVPAPTRPKLQSFQEQQLLTPPPCSSVQTMAERRASEGLGGHSNQFIQHASCSANGGARRGPGVAWPPVMSESADDIGHARSASPAARSASYTERSGVSVSQSEAISSWLDNGDSPSLTSFQLVDWLRLLPANKVQEDTKKAVARRVIEMDISGREFHDIISGGRWAEVAVDDAREAAALARLFKQKQREVTMAEAAQQNARLYANVKALKGEMLVA